MMPPIFRSRIRGASTENLLLWLRSIDRALLADRPNDTPPSTFDADSEWLELLADALLDEIDRRNEVCDNQAGVQAERNRAAI